jgi:uroporphyrinogen-III synthase
MASVILTRPKDRLAPSENFFRAILDDRGIRTIELPMIRVTLPEDTRDLDCALSKLAKGGYDHAVLASPTAVEFFHERVTDLGLAEDIQKRIGFATVGAKSGEKLTSLGYQLKFPLPAQGAGAAALLKTLRTYDLRGTKTLLLQSQIGIVVLERAFEMVGSKTERVTLYETLGPAIADAARLVQLLEGSQDARPEVIAFFSPSAVEQFAKALRELNRDVLDDLPTLAAIGETTAFEIAMRLNRKADIVARKADQKSLAEDIVSWLEAKANS